MVDSCEGEGSSCAKWTKVSLDRGSLLSLSVGDGSGLAWWWLELDEKWDAVQGRLLEEVSCLE